MSETTQPEYAPANARPTSHEDQALTEQRKIQGLSAPADGFDINLNNGGKYNILCQFYHWNYESKSMDGEPVNVSPILLNAITISDSIFAHFKQVALSYYSGLNTFLEHSDSRINKASEPTNNELSTLNSMKPATFTFYGGGKDRVHISFYYIGEDMAMEPYYSQNAIIDDDFVVIKKDESPVDQLNNPTNKTLMTLSLVPAAIYDLMTTYPQWTTGFDKWSPEAETDKMFDVKSGILTGKCIKELIEKCNREIDDDSLDEGIAKINFTSILNNSAYDSICRILNYHASVNGPCIFKWNEFLKKFQLHQILRFFQHPVSDSLNMLSISHQKKDENNGVFTASLSIPPMQSNIKFITEDLSMYISNSLERAPKIVVSRHKSTFSLNFDQYKDEENTMLDSATYFNEMSPDKKNFEYNKPLYCGLARSLFDPHYRVNERDANNNQSILRFFNSFGASYMRPGTDGRIESGRLFTIRSIDGATTDIDKKINGLYLIANVVSEISFVDSRYNCLIVGFKNKQSNPNGFKIGAEEKNPFQLPTSAH